MALADKAVARLQQEQEDWARAITDALYAERPELLARYGTAGREKCLQDMRYNLEHLAPAVAFGDPAIFVAYARWLGDLLAARGIPVDDVVRSLELTCDVVGARLPAEEAAAIVGPVRAGIEALRRTGQS